MADQTVVLYGPRIKMYGPLGGPLKMLCDTYDEKTNTSAIVVVELSVSRGREWTLLMRGWLERPGRDSLTIVTAGKDLNRRDLKVQVELTFPRGQVLEVLPLLEQSLDAMTTN